MQDIYVDMRHIYVNEQQNNVGMGLYAYMQVVSIFESLSLSLSLSLSQSTRLWQYLSHV